MTAAIIPMAPGERPTEPGWYVIQKHDGARDFVHGGRYHYEPEGISMFIVGSTGEEIEAAAMPYEDWTFIARIYPDRIGQEPVNTSASIPIYDEHGRPFQPSPKPEEW